VRGPVDLLAIVRRVSDLALGQRPEEIEVRPIPNEIRRRRNKCNDLGGHPFGVTGAGPNDDDPAAAPPRDVQRWRQLLGTTIIEKYGTESGSTSSSGAIRWPAIVARST
jgi:hypothetical protein